MEMPAAVPHAQTPGLLYCCAHPRKPEPPLGPAEKHESVFQVSRQNTRERWPTIQSTAFWLKQRKYKGQPQQLSTRGSYISEGVQYPAPSVMVIFLKEKKVY